MALRTISQFKGQLAGGGVRPNLFEVTLNFPNGSGQSLSFMSNDTQPTAAEQQIATAGVADKIPFLVKAAALPASNISPVEVPFRGRVLKVAGERTFDTWTVTVLNDTDFRIRTSMEQWMNGISRLTNGSGEVNPSDYTADANVDQLGRNGEIHRRYNFVVLFPTNISEIPLSFDTTDTIEEFTVEFQVLYWTISAITNANTQVAPAVN